MIPFDQIEQLITLEEANNLRVLDATGNKILDIQESSPANAVNTLKNYGAMLSGYGKLTIKGGNDAILKGHFTQGAIWKVYFPNVATVNGWQHGPTQAPKQDNAMNEKYMQLAIELEKVKTETLFDKKFRDLEERLGKKSALPVPMEYMPFIGELLGWDDKKMFQKLQMAGMASNLGALGKMVSENATGGGNKLSISGTDEEKEKQIEQLMPQIWEGKDSAWRTKFATLLATVKQTPALIEQIFEMAKASGQLAGPSAAAEIEQRPATSFGIMNFNGMDDEKF